MKPLEEIIPIEKKHIFQSVKAHAEDLLDHSPKFAYFTLHGKKHINNMFRISSLLCTVSKIGKNAYCKDG